MEYGIHSHRKRAVLEMGTGSVDLLGVGVIYAVVCRILQGCIKTHLIAIPVSARQQVSHFSG